MSNCYDDHGVYILLFFRCFHQFTQCLTVMMTMVSIYLLFFSWRANLDITNPLLLGVVSSIASITVNLPKILFLFSNKMFVFGEPEKKKLVFGVGIHKCLSE